MNSQPLVSIISPSYNQAAFLEKTIRSVLDQDYPNIEYLIADGGSSDGSVDIIRKYEDMLTWWVSEKDKGQAEAINKGFSRAKGEYIAWINSDDYYLPGAVSQAVQSLEQNPDAGLVFGNVQVVNREGEILNTLSYGDWGLEELMSFHIIGQPSVFLRRSVLQKAGFLDTNYHFLLDHQLWLRMGLLAGVKYIPNLWSRAHYHEGCKNLAQAAEFGKEALRIVEWMQSEPGFTPYLKKNARIVQAGAERLNAFYLLDAKYYRASFRSYWRSFWLDPATVLPEWYRMVFALFAPLGLENLRENYLARRKKKFNNKPLD
jgi:glycosyltransferase involved in cell wall biosynthesis